MAHTLYLGSKSPSRKQLLREIQIPFIVVEQDADETACNWSVPLEELVLSIALHKMDHLVLPKGQEGEICFALTADTLSQDIDGTIEGKPVDREDAVRKIKKARNGSRLCSAFCLDKKKFEKGEWQTIDRVQHVVRAEYTFIIPDEWIDRYLKNSFGLTCSNAIAIEAYGSQFVQDIRGSFTAIMGLPLFELRKSLEQLGFFD